MKKKQWFSASLSPLNEWFGMHPLEPIECRCFFSIATIGSNRMAMVLNGLQPLFKRWDGSDPSLWSTRLRFSPLQKLTNEGANRRPRSIFFLDVKLPTRFSSKTFQIWKNGQLEERIS